MQLFLEIRKLTGGAAIGFINKTKGALAEGVVEICAWHWQEVKRKPNL